MTREEILQSFLTDELFAENGYLTPQDAKKFKWATTSPNKLIDVLKTAIEGEVSGESASITERKINAYLNSQQ